MKARIHYYYSTRHRKPIRVEVTLLDDMQDEVAVMDVHGRFATQREATEVGKSIGAHFDAYEETFGRLTVESEPPQIKTEVD